MGQWTSSLKTNVFMKRQENQPKVGTDFMGGRLAKGGGGWWGVNVGRTSKKRPYWQIVQTRISRILRALSGVKVRRLNKLTKKNCRKEGNPGRRKNFRGGSVLNYSLPTAACSKDRVTQVGKKVLKKDWERESLSLDEKKGIKNRKLTKLTLPPDRDGSRDTMSLNKKQQE